MLTTQNGWSVISSKETVNITIPGVPGVQVPVRKGDVAVIFSAFLQRFHKEVQPVSAAGKQRDDWGWVVRFIRGVIASLSNHGSGTAIDINALLHGLGKVGTFTAPELVALRRLLKDFPGIRWGGDFTGRKDEMHFEWIASAAAAAALATKLLTNPVATSHSSTVTAIAISSITYTTSAKKIVVHNAIKRGNVRGVKASDMPMLHVYATDGGPNGYVSYFQQKIGWTPAQWDIVKAFIKRWFHRDATSGGWGYLSPECIIFAQQIPQLKNVFADGVIGPKTWNALGHPL